jgi:type IV secretion system protein VirB9
VKALRLALLALPAAACAPVSAAKSSSDSLVTSTVLPPVAMNPQAPRVPGAVYKLSGDRRLLPISIQDDGARVYLRWSASQALPAVFAVGDQGQEEVVNGYMRDDTFVIDRVYGRLVFRIDKARALASRKLARAR